jgi:hypothetical protein
MSPTLAVTMKADPLPILPEFRAAYRALRELQKRLAELDGWRASLAWEAVEDAQCALAEGLFDAFELPNQPANFKHWKESFPEGSPFF